MKIQNSKFKILISPLNWGIGHATRCIPIINALIKQGFTPIIASDGDSLTLLQKEFPKLTSYKLPSYDIKYSKYGFLLKFKILFRIFKINNVIKKEHQEIEKIITSENIKGIISDNRFGVYNKNIPSVYITHQVNILTGITTKFSSKIHQKIIANFNTCWVPDNKGNANFTGDLSKNNKPDFYKYIGILSRLKKEIKPKKYDYLILLSGPEPQRTILEHKLILAFNNTTKKILFVRGLVSEKNKLTNTKNYTFINFLNTSELQNVINESNVIIARSGYSTIMDLAILGKKAFFIPTPGQGEQEYLAKRLDNLNIAPFSEQRKFTVSMLKKLENYTGFNSNITLLDNFPFSIF